MCRDQEFAIAITIANKLNYPGLQIRIRNLEINSKIILIRFAMFSARGVPVREMTESHSELRLVIRLIFRNCIGVYHSQGCGLQWLLNCFCHQQM